MVVRVHWDVYAAQKQTGRKQVSTIASWGHMCKHLSWMTDDIASGSRQQINVNTK